MNAPFAGGSRTPFAEFDVTVAVERVKAVEVARGDFGGRVGGKTVGALFARNRADAGGRFRRAFGLATVAAPRIENANRARRIGDFRLEKTY